MKAVEMTIAQICKEIEQANNVIANATKSRQYWLDELAGHVASGNDVIIHERSK
jgi:hypothetical protein